jgi:hypothetical protein
MNSSTLFILEASNVLLATCNGIIQPSETIAIDSSMYKVITFGDHIKNNRILGQPDYVRIIYLEMVM